MKFLNNQWEKNRYRVMTVILLLILIGFGALEVRSHLKIEEEDNKLLCSRIEGTPAWADNLNQILGYGVVNFTELGLNTSAVDFLINNSVKFVYSSQCIHCKHQIEIFEDEWQKYQDSGLTIDCAQLN